MKFGAKSIIIGAVAAAGLALSATSASAYVACNDQGECWHVHHHGYYHYRPAWGITVHPDSWRWGSDEHYRWRDHDPDRGYWRNGVWITF